MSQRNVNSTGMSQWLIHCAARHAPQSFAQRLEEEWSADLAERRSGMSRLAFAIGCCWASRVIAQEHQPLAVAVTAATTDGTVAETGIAQRSSTLFAVVSLHGVVFYILMTTVLHIPKVNHGPLQLVPTITHPRETVTMPNMGGIEIDIPKPLVTILRKPDPIEDVTTVVDPPIGPVAPPSEPSPHQVLQVQGGPGAGFPNPDDFYPLPAKYLEEQGVAIVQVCVDPKGRLTSVPTTLQGTGSSRLDQGALKLAAAGSGHYRASTEDGQAVNSCFPLRVRFQLKN